MNDDLDLSTILVADLLQSSPKAPRFFINQKTDCASCLLAKFCSLQDVVNAYELDRKAFLEGLDQLTVQHPKRGEIHENFS